jgi:hypothetical protein
MRSVPKLCAVLAAAMLFSSCLCVPAKRVDTVLRGARVGDLNATLSEVSVSALLSQADIERVAREVFPLAAARAGIAPGMDEERSAARAAPRAEYVLWLHEEEHTVGIDTYSAVLCVLKLRSKADGALIATTIVSDETKLNLRSSGYVYSLLREALVSLRGAVSASPKASGK